MPYTPEVVSGAAPRAERPPFSSHSRSTIMAENPALKHANDGGHVRSPQFRVLRTELSQDVN